MGKLIEAKIVQKRKSTSGANEPSHENESLRLYLNGMLSQSQKVNIKVHTWFDATLVYRFNECNRRSYNS